MKIVNFLSVVALFIGSIFSTIISGQDLTGIWQDDNGTRYSVRQVGNEIFWRMDSSPSVINVFFGTIAGKTITGEWADLPGGLKMGGGTLALHIETNDRLIRIGRNGNYGASVWIRIPVFTQPVYLPKNRSAGQNVPPPIGWDYAIHFEGPKVPNGKAIPPPFPSSFNMEMYDQLDTGQPKARLEIVEIEQIYSDPIENCYWPGKLLITIKNVGNKVADEDLSSIRGEMTALGIDPKVGKYEYVNVPLVVGSGQREWRRTKHGMEPGESRKITAQGGFLTGMTVHSLSDFWVRVNMITFVWDEETQDNKQKIVQTIVKEFSSPGFDLSITRGSFYVWEHGKNRAVLMLAVKNIGEVVTPGPVKISVQIPKKNPKSIIDYWAEFKFQTDGPLKPGEEAYTDPELTSVYIEPPEKSRPDVDNMLVIASVSCQQNKGLSAFDKNLSNNYFFGKSRVINASSKWK